MGTIKGRKADPKESLDFPLRTSVPDRFFLIASPPIPFFLIRSSSLLLLLSCLLFIFLFLEFYVSYEFHVMKKMEINKEITEIKNDVSIWIKGRAAFKFLFSLFEQFRFTLFEFVISDKAVNLIYRKCFRIFFEQGVFFY